MVLRPKGVSESILHSTGRGFALQGRARIDFNTENKMVLRSKGLLEMGRQGLGKGPRGSKSRTSIVDLVNLDASGEERGARASGRDRAGLNRGVPSQISSV